jgi:hypothetical protein
MATFSKKMGGKEVGQASTYATPHTMSGKAVKAEENPGVAPGEPCMTIGAKRTGAAPAVKTSGIKMRGAGAATKGVMSRGPMA